MKKFARTTQGILLLLIGSFIAFLFISGAAARFSRVPDERLGSAAFFVQTTPTAQIEMVSEIGSTDGIVLMGAIITLIVVLPVLLRRKSLPDE